MNQSDSQVKYGLKGICKREADKLTLRAFVDALYNDKIHYSENRGMVLNRDMRMSMYMQRKLTFNTRFRKFRILNDRITCQPLELNGIII